MSGNFPTTTNGGTNIPVAFGVRIGRPGPAGPQGPEGPQGPQGPEGPPGEAVGLADHVDSPTPHPVYDDLQSLTLIFENGLV